uniref:G-protein coupled receptors family 1 profile domain-containing protein n=1 Tax=Sphenodon punctatus TaxID=8508 RepID=A0A8D0HEI8_SPHPU
MTPACNSSDNLSPSSFLPAGIPGLESAHIWFAVPFFVVYLVTLVANATLLVVIKNEGSLHEPVYLLLAMLATTDLSLVTSIVPRVLAVVWSDTKEIGYNACLTQMFFIPAFYVMESWVLLAMALDGFLAIRYPLRYATILTHVALTKAGLAVLARAVTMLTPAPLLVRQLESFRTKVISYCAYMAVVQPACGDISVSVTYAVFKLPSKEARLKALSTCDSHLCVILFFYSPVVFTFLAQTFGLSLAPHVSVMVDNFYFLVPPMLNPIVYGVRTKQLRERVAKMLRCQKQ